MALPYPEIGSDIVSIGPFVLRWYAVAYMIGLIGGWGYMRFLITRPPYAMSAEQTDDFLTWATLGTVLGGRLGYVLFYKPGFYLSHPQEILQLWNGGMSFHGGALGVILGVALFARRNRLSLLAVGDLAATVVPIGLLFGRLGNFVNGELFGREAPADLPWAMVFPTDPLHIPRHPSQLYEATLEGLLLLILLHLAWRVAAVRERPGMLGGLFLIGYALARSTAEVFRQPDSYLGFLWGGATMGQLLSLPFLLAGLLVLVAASRRPRWQAVASSEPFGTVTAS